MDELSSDGTKLVLRASKRPGQMLAAYLANMQRGSSEVREMILEDIRRFSELGARTYVDDLTEVLFRFDDAEFVVACPRSTVMSAVAITQ
jgi:hypothetical protein